jgi:hypothetical protein
LQSPPWPRCQRCMGDRSLFLALAWWPLGFCFSLLFCTSLHVAFPITVPCVLGLFSPVLQSCALACLCTPTLLPALLSSQRLPVPSRMHHFICLASAFLLECNLPTLLSALSHCPTHFPRQVLPHGRYSVPTCFRTT